MTMQTAKAVAADAAVTMRTKAAVVVADVVTNAEWRNRFEKEVFNPACRNYDVCAAIWMFVEKTGDTFTVTTEEGSTYEGGAVILAVGVKHRMLGLPGEQELVGNGISFCAVCDGAFYAGQNVAMIGGGNSALQEALLLSEVCKKVTVVQNLADFTGEKKLSSALMEKENVTAVFSTVVSEYLQKDGQLTGLKLHNDATGEDSQIDVDGAFLAVGLVPENDAFAGLAKLNDWGYFDSAEDCCTKTPGVFVAGDCRSKRIRQVVTASADGAIAAMAACRYLD
jgi:thioredoxin reductase (NADPH)